MNIEDLRQFCLSLPSATEDIKWSNDLCFSIGGKMFCVCSLEPPPTITIKVVDDEFDELCSSHDIRIADYVGRYKWITVENESRFSHSEWKERITQSYSLIAAKLPKKVRENLC
jgi:predicted DNA-binding protein (MmcQ/YjbR family)